MPSAHHEVALGFATGALTSYANSPRPVVRGRPVEVIRVNMIEHERGHKFRVWDYFWGKQYMIPTPLTI